MKCFHSLVSAWFWFSCASWLPIRDLIEYRCIISKIMDVLATVWNLLFLYVSKGYYRAAKCHLVMGSIANAENYLQKVLEKDPKNKDAQNDVSIYLGIKQENPSCSRELSYLNLSSVLIYNTVEPPMAFSSLQWPPFWFQQMVHTFTFILTSLQWPSLHNSNGH